MQRELKGNSVINCQSTNEKHLDDEFTIWTVCIFFVTQLNYSNVSIFLAVSCVHPTLKGCFDDFVFYWLYVLNFISANKKNNKILV